MRDGPIHHFRADARAAMIGVDEDVFEHGAAGAEAREAGDAGDLERPHNLAIVLGDVEPVIGVGGNSVESLPVAKIG